MFKQNEVVTGGAANITPDSPNIVEIVNPELFLKQTFCGAAFQ